MEAKTSPVSACCKGMGSGSGAPGSAQASIQSLRTTRQGLPLWARVMTVSSLPLSTRR
ncbi:hypothetical protein D3C78_1984150 [compost metagenome]